MNEMNSPSPDELDLLRRLRRLPRERDTAVDLWPGIEARLGAGTRTIAAPMRSPRWGAIGLAAAALLVLAFGLMLRRDPTPLPADAPLAQVATPYGAGDALLRREAEAITLEYRLALEPFAAAPMPPELRAAAIELDASAEQLRDALRAQPEATYLLERLRRTYDQRLRLTQRALLG
jgi:hypothetical protein